MGVLLEAMNMPWSYGTGCTTSRIFIREKGEFYGVIKSL